MKFEASNHLVNTDKKIAAIIPASSRAQNIWFLELTMMRIK